MVAKSPAVLQAELEKLDERRAELNEQISEAEEERANYQKKADIACEEKKKLIEQRRKLPPVPEAEAQEAPVHQSKPRGRGKRSSDADEGLSAAVPAAKAPRGRGRLSEEHAPAGKATKSPASKSPAGKVASAGASSASVNFDAVAGTVVDGSIVVPSHEQALVANLDESLFWPTFMFREIRDKKLHEYRALEQPPGAPNTWRLGYLVSLNDECASGFDGFVLWKEEWGRRNSYSVELLALGYAEPRDDTALPKRLLEAMRTRIDTARATGVFTDLSEKAKASEQTYWKSLNFKGISGSKTLEWNISA